MIGVAQHLWIGNGAEQVADQAVEFGVGNEVRGLLVAQGAAEHARKTDQRAAAAGQAVGLAVGADQLTLDAECGGLREDEPISWNVVRYPVLPNVMRDSSSPQ